MSDIIDRLEAVDDYLFKALHNDAVDEIKRLRRIVQRKERVAMDIVDKLRLSNTAELAPFEEWADHRGNMLAAADEIERLRKENAELRAAIPDTPRREYECVTLEHWRDRAMYLEYQWSACSQTAARLQTERDAFRDAATVRDRNEDALRAELASYKREDEIKANVNQQLLTRAERAEAERNALRADAERAREWAAAIHKYLDAGQDNAILAVLTEMRIFALKNAALDAAMTKENK